MADLYGMTNTPFIRNIPVSEIYRNDVINNVISRLKYACVNKQFAVLVGDSGTGKTTMLRYVSTMLPATDYTTIYISEYDLTPRMFYNQILVQLGYNHTMQFTNARLAVQQEVSKLQRKLVVIIDEGQTLSYDMLSEIRFMLNYKMDSENPFALIISANNEFWNNLKHERFRSTVNRVDLECRLTPYTLDQTREYIERQVAFAGYNGQLFTEEATSKVFKASKGIASMINRICTLAIRLGSQLKREAVDDTIIDDVLKTEITATMERT